MIFRYTFDDAVSEELFSFAKINQYLPREEYKEKWQEWLEEKNELVSCETRRLEGLGYKGNVNDKMFKSARYYFRGKTTAGEPKQRRKYVSPDKELLNKIDEFLKLEMTRPEFTPKQSFLKFCETFQEDDTIKKVFKNRYFVLATKKKLKPDI
jgi:hypothetical protein